MQITHKTVKRRALQRAPVSDIHLLAACPRAHRADHLGSPPASQRTLTFSVVINIDMTNGFFFFFLGNRAVPRVTGLDVGLYCAHI